MLQVEPLRGAMRFILLVIVAAAAGAVSVSLLQGRLPHSASMAQAVRALGGEWSDFKIADLNPVTAYRKVMAEITSPSNAGMPRFGMSQIPSIQVIGPIFKPYEYKPDPAIQRAIAAGIGARVSQDIRRAQDITAYGRNPMAWHGVPPR